MRTPKFLYRLHGRIVERGYARGNWSGYVPSPLDSLALALVRFLLDRFEMQEVWGVPWWDVREWEWREERADRE